MLGLSALSAGIKAIDGITDPEKVKENMGSLIASLMAVGVSPTFPADISTLGSVTQFNTGIPGPVQAQGVSMSRSSTA